jgi:hypothetical protein
MGEDLIVETILAGVLAVVLWIFNDAVTQLRLMRESLNAVKECIIQLNGRLGIVIERIDSHEKRIARLEEEEA